MFYSSYSTVIRQRRTFLFIKETFRSLFGYNIHTQLITLPALNSHSLEASLYFRLSEDDKAKPQLVKLQINRKVLHLKDVLLSGRLQRLYIYLSHGRFYPKQRTMTRLNDHLEA